MSTGHRAERTSGLARDADSLRIERKGLEREWLFPHLRYRWGNESKNPCKINMNAAEWWARQDSNLQPDRYERPALTIELQAPPRDGRGMRGRQRCAVRLQGASGRRNAGLAGRPERR